MLTKLLHGFFFGIGFAVAFALVWSIYSFVALPAVITSTFEESPARTIHGEPVEMMPVGPTESADERKFELHTGVPKMELTSGGGILSISITDAPANSDRPSSIQAWITESEAFLIETVGETPTVKKMPYPKNDAVKHASDLVYEYAGFRASNSTMTIAATDVRRLKDGRPTERARHMNGMLRITKEGVVFFVPNRFEK